MKTITLTGFKRPAYMVQVLAALKQNDTSGYTLYCGLEPGCPETVAICQAIDWMPTVIVVNDARLGVKLNPFSIISRAMNDGSEFNVVIEDDIALSEDALGLANWFSLRSSDYLALCFFNFASQLERRNDIFETNHFTSVGGFAFSVYAWRRLIEYIWCKDERGWDFALNELTENSAIIKTLHPGLSRARNLGRQGGTHCTPDIYDDKFRAQKFSEGKGHHYQLIRKMDKPSASPPTS